MRAHQFSQTDQCYIYHASKIKLMIIFFLQRPSEDTYIVLRSRLTSSSYQAYRFNLGASLWCLGPVNPLRILTIRIVTNPYPLQLD